VDGEATFSFDQFILFLAIVFRDRYRAVAQASFPEVADRLPLVSGGKLTVVQVNSGEAVHFVYHGTPDKESTAARHMSIQPPDGMRIRDWAMLNEEGYRRFVERALPSEAAVVAHYVVFPDEGDWHAGAAHAADRFVRAHAAALRS
jgi:hypothetical protein